LKLPETVQLLIDEAIKHVKEHPKHELGQARRKTIYTALHQTPEGTICCKWLAILSAKRVENIYIEQTVHWKTQGNAQDKIEWAIKAISEGEEWAKEELIDDWDVATRMIAITEGVLIKTISADYAKQALILTYHPAVGAFAHASTLNQKGYLALRSAYQALNEVLGSMPLQHSLSDGIQSSREWEDQRLAGVGGGVDDAAVNAAFSFAGDTENKNYDIEKLKTFWLWWLTDGMNEAWEKANDLAP
jgi:hypothetical protein